MIMSHKSYNGADTYVVGFTCGPQTAQFVGVYEHFCQSCRYASSEFVKITVNTILRVHGNIMKYGWKNPYEGEMYIRECYNVASSL